jgi:hypothetical protein
MERWAAEGALGDSLASGRERRPPRRRKRNDVLDQNRAAFDPLSRKPIKCLLVPGGRVLNPQSYHSAFRISSTRHEEAFAGRKDPSC